MSEQRAVPARNNALLCDAVCRGHGLFGVFDADVWSCHTRTPTFYPDAVTLDPNVSEDVIVARIDNTAGASIKDSFATLDLAPHGYDVLFDATWYAGRAQGARDVEGWSVIESPDVFDQWVHAWRGIDGPGDVWTPGVLSEDSLVFAALKRHDELLAGALFNRGDDAVGISNVFAPGCPTEEAFAGVVAFAGVLFGDTPIVGYGDDDELALATANGFQAAGPLRVWIRS
jgi:hypothetical protein